MIQNTARPRGRPRSFDETGALERATQVFRSKGYDGATIDDLVAGMGVGRPSLVEVDADALVERRLVLVGVSAHPSAGRKARHCHHWQNALHC